MASAKNCEKLGRSRRHVANLLHCGLVAIGIIALVGRTVIVRGPVFENPIIRLTHHVGGTLLEINEVPVEVKRNLY